MVRAQAEQHLKQHLKQVIIGVDPHKLSATIEVVDDHERKLGQGRITTDRAGFAAMRASVKAWPVRTWAVEGANGTGRSLARRLLADGEHVVDVPAELAARVRLFDTGHNRKTDPHDAHSIAVVAVRTTRLRVLAVDGELEALRMLVDRREALSRRRVQSVNRLHALLAELIPGQAKKDITVLQAKALLASVRSRDTAGKTRRRIAAEELPSWSRLTPRSRSPPASSRASSRPARRQVVVGFEVLGRPIRRYWLVVDADEVSICRHDPGFSTDVAFRCDAETLYRVYLGDLTLSHAQRVGRLEISGDPTALRQAPAWFAWPTFAPAARSAGQRRADAPGHAAAAPLA